MHSRAINLLTPSQTIPPSRDYRKAEISVITISEPVPDITGVVNNIYILCDSTEAFKKDIPYKMEEDTLLNIYYLLSLMRDILKNPFLSPAILQLEHDIYEIVSSQ
ncbi:hypothetical protein ASPFODRAFT_29635 [Aspergillus luchuensis CBS 106.47]|uniref:Uncharacterized protein n=1 Tax=Aspergillus luchuensis (strain CBS 106.47) TaxID=1137211 RepID=A0A1M3TWZ3_ASPLC|nr:hypothetical protein ASPFODRAFT_29635 [Aspergillus luchuensis CBS 106.47]